MTKSKLNLDEQIEYMQNQGIVFNLMSKEQAKQFLSESNYFFKIKAFAKNYDKNKNNQYIRLEFAYLREISIIDTLLRDIILEFCLTYEHLLKTQINTHCSNDKNQDGYTIVKDFLANNEKPHALKVYEKSRYCHLYQRDLIKKYYKEKANGGWDNHFALWNFIEILTFSEFIKFYTLYCKQSKLKPYSFIREINQLRNAAAHNFCILHNLKTCGDSCIKTTKLLQSKVRALSIFNKNKKLTHLEKPIMHDCICLLFAIKELCPPKMFRKLKKKLLAFLQRAKKRKEYFINNQYIASSFNFAVKLILKII